MDRLGAYWLGAGLGDGAVREAYDEEGSRYALKLLPRVADAAVCRAAQRVNSLYVAKLVEAHLEDDPPFLVSEYVPGPTLRRVVAGCGPYGRDELYRLAAATATALAAIHEAGAAHGRVDPDHVLLGPDGPRLIGLGGPGSPEGPAGDIRDWARLMLFAATAREQPPGLTEVPADPAVDRPLRDLLSAALHPDPEHRPGARRLLLALLDVPQSQQGRLLPPAPVDDPPLGERAEQVYQGLPGPDQEAVPEVFLRLVDTDEQGADARRAAARDELPPAAGPILDRYGEAGLLTVGETVSITHPALLRAWPRLRAWLDAEREGLAVHRELAAAARRWDRGGRREADLFGGEALEHALAWAATRRRRVRLSAEEQAFLDAGTALRRGRARRRRAVTACLLAAALVGTVTGVARTIAMDGRLEEAMARLAAERAESLRLADPVTSRRLSVAAWRLAPIEESARALRSSGADPAVTVFADPHATDRSIHSLSDDGSHLAALTSGRLRVYDIATGRQLVAKDVPEKIRALAWAPDGRKLAMVGAERTYLWDAWSGRQLGAIERGLDWPGELSAWFSPGGGLVFAADRQRDERWAWDLRAGRVVFDGEYALVRPDDQAAVVFDGPASRIRWLDTGRVRPAPWLATMSLEYAAFSPDGRRIAIATERGVQIYDLDGVPQLPLPLTPAAGPLRFSGDGGLLAGTSNDHVWVWRLSGGGTLLADRPLPSAGARPAQARFTGDGLRVLTGQGVVIGISLPDRSPERDPERIAEALCERFGGLSPAEWGRLLAGLPHRETC
ncbi:protein kinase family protein [Thermoactinospora rubra]|uniref:protein kinase family protein n=1 Tax=Thermoactinospora rubra TaxID=1088767 RepID=UPI000A10C54C|nr:protein kinase family protein [Thermoactinospora rubra]